MRLKELKEDIDGRYGLRCGRVHESRMDVWIAHDHAEGVVVHKSGKCEPWRIDGASVAKGAPFHLTLPWLKPRDSCELGLLVTGWFP